jgi:NAD+--asparagine ADP-ribosyltransferase
MQKSITIDTNLSLQDLLLSVENQINSYVTEICFVFDSHKNLVLTKEGELSFISFTETELALLKNTYFTHNHPKSGFLSVTDIEFAHTWNLEEMRAVTNSEVYVITKPQDGWNEPQFFQVLKYEKETIKKAYFKDEITKEVANQRYFEEVPKTILQKLGITFKNIKL